MPYTPSHTWVAGDFIRASWLNLDTTNLADHETRIVTLEGATAVLALDELTDVTLGSPVSSGEVLTWNGSAWTNDVAASALDELTDVTLGSPVSSGESLVYNGSVWTNQVASSITWLGAWNSGTAYVANDAVYHNGTSYIATSGSTNNEPGVGSPDPWDILALSGLAGVWTGVWDSGTTYALGDLVQHSGSSYIATSGSTNNEPGVGSPDPWDLVAAKGDTGSVGALDDLTDVSAAAPNDGDVLTYQAGSPTGWIAAAAVGGGWELADSWTHSGDVANVDFTNLGSYSELLVVTRLITRGVSGTEALQVSVNNGSTFFSSSGDYVAITQETGAETNTTSVRFFGTFSTLARSGTVQILATNVTSAVKVCDATNRSSTRTSLFVGSTSPINAIRVLNPEGGNLTAGSIYVFGR